jgi:hypothetical protein
MKAAVWNAMGRPIAAKAAPMEPDAPVLKDFMKTKTKPFKKEGRKPKTVQDLKNRNRNSALSGERISVQAKEKKVRATLNEDTQPDV